MRRQTATILSGSSIKLRKECRGGSSYNSLLKCACWFHKVPTVGRLVNSPHNLLDQTETRAWFPKNPLAKSFTAPIQRQVQFAHNTYTPIYVVSLTLIMLVVRPRDDNRMSRFRNPSRPTKQRLTIAISVLPTIGYPEMVT